MTTIDELVTLDPSVEAVALSFDDAFVNVGEVAAPRLIAAGLPATLFVVSSRAGATNAWNGVPAPGIPNLPLLDWDAIGRLAEVGIHVGSHSRTHPDLTRLGEGALNDEVIGSADAIQAHTGIRPSVFAYPYGSVDERTAGLVRTSYRFACTTAFQALQGAEDTARLPRLDAYSFQRPGALDAWGTPAFERFVRRRDRLRRLRRAPGHFLRQVLSLHGQ